MNDKWFGTYDECDAREYRNSTIAIGNPSNSVNGVFDTQCVLQFEMFVARGCVSTARDIDKQQKKEFCWKG